MPLSLNVKVGEFMFCPKCKAEYRDGFSRCADCDIDLVTELTPEPEKVPIEWVEVLSTFNNGDISLLKSILDSEDVTYYFHGEHFNAVRPWAQPAILMVDKNEIDKVKDLIKDLKFSFRGIALNGDQRDDSFKPST